MKTLNSFGTQSTLSLNQKNYRYHSLPALGAQRSEVTKLPFSLKILLENLLRHEDGVAVKKQDIEAYGVEKFNEACRTMVLKYADEWKRIIPRMGRWVDMENAYRTMWRSWCEGQHS